VRLRSGAEFAINPLQQSLLSIFVRNLSAKNDALPGAADTQSVRYAIDIVKPGRDEGDLENSAVVKAPRAECRVVCRTALRGVARQLHYVIDHHAILFADGRAFVIPLQRLNHVFI
jgi:hypothetical protein